MAKIRSKSDRSHVRTADSHLLSIAVHARISVMSAYSCAQVQRTQAARAPKCRASEVSADVRDNSKDCTRDDLRESMTRLVLGMRRMTTLHDTSTASGALEAFVSLFSATANVCGGGGAPTHGRRSYSSARRGLRTPSASIHTEPQRMPKKSGSNRSSTDHARL